MLILKKSCKALITALCTLFIYSCSSNDKLDINNYQLQSIQWKLSANDAEKVDTIELPPKITSNNTEEPMSITFSFQKNIKETSQFYSDDPELFNSLTLKENILVDITANASTLSSEYRKLSSDLHAPLSLNETVLSPLYKSKETLKLSPHTKVTTECKIYIKEYTATYLAIFANDKGETIEMSGKWKGAFNKGSKVTYILKDIK